ncbi:hypothetical protein Dimus_027343, partial [Dionaea muscipula]
MSEKTVRTRRPKLEGTWPQRPCHTKKHGRAKIRDLCRSEAMSHMAGMRGRVRQHGHASRNSVC